MSQCRRAMRRLFPVVVVLVVAAGVELAAAGARDGRALLQSKSCGKNCACPNRDSCVDDKTGCCWDTAAPSSQCKAVASLSNTVRTATGACGCTNGWTPGPNGGCVCAAGKTVCPSGACVTLGTNSDCSACGNACASPYSCQEVGPDAFGCNCPTQQLACGEPLACVLVDTDQHCGGCAPCTEGNTCQYNPPGRHLLSLTYPDVSCRCPADKASCADGSCVTLGTDSNCASCGNACALPRTCEALSPGVYTCACPGSQWYCGETSGCVDLDTDENCGRFGNACTGGKTCQQSVNPSRRHLLSPLLPSVECLCPQGYVECSNGSCAAGWSSCPVWTP
ncbi:hypothetical protein HYH03_003131 [Edaphochlamys debaryana]|uniref:Uncharacterized protein n=1 Tax=Edaphochlamys debaryana TaxID=47281 RepID=A0A836C3C0_9CHLO|nr:hypothetical protein HYH03_003131 [Edaphochlamys debaryana]|eukprot:KAG2498941.1 hypothetical protein HYH03_003131 [Edaphochlamys debaryana]